MRFQALPLIALALGVVPGLSLAQTSTPVVKLTVNPDGRFTLIRDGQPYFVRGAGGDGSMERLANLGGNSIRTWGVDANLGRRLDEAHRLGLSVCVGLWLGHERHGFDYNDPAQLARQIEEVLAAVERFKNHPAVLLWGIGNEMEGDGNNAAVWMAVNDLARRIKAIDPNHPTMTVIAELGGQKIANLNRFCPDVDIVGINSYGGAASVPTRYRKAGGTKPYILTEFGPAGRWEIEPTAWGAPPEPSSTAKAAMYRKAYESAVLGAPGLCLGSYAFIWGHKQEATATWFGILLPDGSRLAAADTLSMLWTGRDVPNKCPEISSLTLDGPNQVEPGATVQLSLKAGDPEGDPIRVQWVVRREVGQYSTGGDAEQAPPEYPDAIVQASDQSAIVRLPDDPGAYRVFAYIRDDHEGAAVANVPLRVRGEEKIAARKPPLPLVVYDEAAPESGPYAPSGWMGNREALSLENACRDRPHAGKTCLRIQYKAPDQWAGIVWQDPPNDWGDKPGGLDLSDARRLSFWARSPDGATISVEYGILGRDKPYFDTARGKRADLKLGPEWQRYTIDLAGQDLRRIKTGFVVVLTGNGGPQTVDLDTVVYE